ncbi:hypothetical protein RHMOL_Rhmol03G0090200 [Rhododendron molle]|uniref:Uncharacterized protein n=1 Tax=Rhododendron molle TaxID=49168 RepID=A0ACC0PDE4_RHOML|nr:hypothetical protein RHMOL_Rhmol03G0090200 [Rhododendron molle]
MHRHGMRFGLVGQNGRINKVEHPLKEHRINELGFVTKRVNMMERDMQLVIGTHLQLHKCTQTRHIPMGNTHLVVEEANEKESNEEEDNGEESDEKESDEEDNGEESNEKESDEEEGNEEESDEKEGIKNKDFINAMH